MTETVLRLLTDQVRFATGEQVAGVLGTEPGATARKLQALARAGWVASAVVIVRRPRVESPLMTDRDPAALAASVAWRLETRWGRARPRAARLWWATRRTAQLYGGRFSGIRQPLQVEHDLLLLDVLTRRTAGPGWQWAGEDDLRDEVRDYGGKLPDAVVTAGGVRTVVEIGGQYSATRLAAFVAAMTRSRTAFEVW